MYCYWISNKTLGAFVFAFVILAIGVSLSADRLTLDFRRIDMPLVTRHFLPVPARKPHLELRLTVTIKGISRLLFAAFDLQRLSALAVNRHCTCTWPAYLGAPFRTRMITSPTNTGTMGTCANAGLLAPTDIITVCHAVA